MIKSYHRKKRKTCAGIFGSPRPAGNSATLLERSLATLAADGMNIERFFLDRMHIEPCDGCLHCAGMQRCSGDDDMKTLLLSLISARYVIVSSPIYFGSVSAQVKTMIDRCQVLWVKDAHRVYRRRERFGAFIAVSHTPDRRSFLNARSVIKNFFSTLGIQYTGELFISGCEGPDFVGKHPVLLDRATRVGKRLSVRRS